MTLLVVVILCVSVVVALNVMSLLRSKVPSFINGVSQESVNQRIPGQANVQTNALASLTDGLRKRPPLQHIAKLDDDVVVSGSDTINDLTKANFHFIDREDNNHIIGVYQYDSDSVGIVRPYTTSGTLVNDLPGTGLDLGYLKLSGDGYKETPIKFCQAGDYTLLLNTTKTVAAHTGTQGAEVPEKFAVVFSRKTAHTFSITVTYTNDSGDIVKSLSISSGTPNDMAVEFATEVADSTHGFGGSGISIAAERLANVVIVTATSASNGRFSKIDMSAGTNDEVPEYYVQTFRTEIDSPDSLPAKFKAGYVLKIAGDPISGYDDYWVEFVATSTEVDTGLGTGYWMETSGYDENGDGIKFRLDPSNLYHIIAYSDEDTEWKIASTGTTNFAWTTKGTVDNPFDVTKASSQRNAGDDLTNPFPNFVDKKITSLEFYKNRLAAFTNDTVDFTEVGEFANFFRNTVLSYPPSEPFQLSVNLAEDLEIFQSMVFKDLLIAFGDKIQLGIGSGDASIFTASTAEVDVLSRVRLDQRTAPVGSELSMVAAGNRADSFGSLTRFQASQQVAGMLVDEDLTIAVPHYIEGRVRQLAVLPEERIIVALTHDDSDSLYVYNYYVGQGTEARPENLSAYRSWSKFTFAGANIHGIGFIDKELYVVNRRDEAWHLEKMNFTPDTKDTNQDFITHLDRRVDETQCTESYDSGTGKTTVTLPYDIESGVTMKAYTRGSGAVTEITVTNATVGGNTLDLTGDYTSEEFYIGHTYTMTYTFPLNPMYDDSGAILSGRSQYRVGVLDYEESMAFSVTVNNYQGTSYTYDFSETALDEGQFRFPIRSRNKDATVSITSDSALPCKINAGEFEIEYENRSR